MSGRNTPADPIFVGDQSKLIPPGASAQRGELSFRAGTIIDGKYRIIRELGRGGMGSVYLVEQMLLRKEFALKTLSPEHLSEKSIVRFQKEARAASLLNHHGLIKVYDFGLVGDRPYFVMDYIAGEALSDHIKKSGPLPLDIALPAFIQVAFALSYAHERGIVHRDLKPSNIMFDKTPDSGDQIVKIVDFGIAKLMEDEQHLTVTGEVFGSPNYMSPEQCMGLAVDHRSDIYSFGCVLYESLTGFPPFVSDSALSLMMKHQTEAAIPMREATLGVEFPPDLEVIVAKLLAKDPEDRYGNFSAVANDLNRVMAGRIVKGIADKKLPAVKEKRNYKFLPYILGAAVFVIGFSAGNFQLPQVVPPPVKKIDLVILPSVGSRDSKEKALRRQRIKAENDNYMAKVANPNFKYSTISPDGTRTFDFPRNIYVGIMTYPNWKNKSGYIEKKAGVEDESRAATRKVVIKKFQPFNLTLNGLNNPELLRPFRPDEISSIRIKRGFEDNGELPVGVKILKYIRGMKQLVHLSLSESEFNSDFIKYANEVPNLEGIDCSNLSVTDRDLLQLKQLKQLYYLDVSSINPMHRLCDALQDSEIRHLNMKSCGLTDGDLAKLSYCKKLSTLNISRNKQVTDAGVKALLQDNSSLEKLWLVRCSVTPDVWKYVFDSKVRELYLDVPSWSKQTREQFQKNLWGHCIVEFEEAKEQLDPKELGSFHSMDDK